MVIVEAQSNDLPIALTRRFEVESSHEHRGGRQIIARVGGERARIELRRSKSSRSPASIIVALGTGALHRSQAAHRFLALAEGQTASDPALRPSAYQRHRLARNLAILDALAEGAGVKKIAFGILFPHSRLLVGAEWKASSERRQTQRVIRESLRLRDRGFLELPGFVTP